MGRGRILVELPMFIVEKTMVNRMPRCSRPWRFSAAKGA